MLLKSLEADSRSRLGARAFVAAAVYVLFGWFGLHWAIGPAGASLVWPASGFGVALLLVFRRQMLPALWVGECIVSLLFFFPKKPGLPEWLALGLVLLRVTGAMLQPMAIAFALRKRAGGVRFALRPRTFFLFAAIAGLGATIAPSITTAIGLVAGVLSLQEAGQTWVTFWLGDFLGILIVTPLILFALLPKRKPAIAKHARKEALAFVAALTLLCLLLVSEDLLWSGTNGLALSFLTFPFMVWGAFRFSTPGVALATSFLWVASMLGAFSGGSNGENLVSQIPLALAQSFSAVLAITGLSLSAALRERERARNQLRLAHKRLEKRVEERTAQLNASKELLERELAERRSTEEALRESESRYRMIVENRTELIVRWTPDGQFTFVNEYCCKVLNVSFESALRSNMLDLLNAEEREQFLRRVREVNAQCPDFITEQQLRTADGRLRWVQWNHRANFNETGELIDFQSVGWDITHRRVAEDALRRTNQLNRRILETVPGGILLLSGRGEVLLSSRYAADMLNLDSQPGATIERLFPGLMNEEGEMVSVLDHPAMRCLSSGEDQAPRTFGFRRPDGQICWAVFSAAPFFDPVTRRQDGAVVAFVDITERKQTEQERERLERRMLEAQKLESLGVLAGGIAHDFNNLLVSILGNAGLALMELGPESPARATVQTIETAAIRASELTRQLLAYSGRGRFVVEPVSLNRIVDEMIQILRVSVSRKVSLLFDSDGPPPVVEADASQLRQVVMNLITNASEAIGDRAGVIRLRTFVRSLDGIPAEVSAVAGRIPAGEYACLEVEDTGCGMDEETIRRMFEPFFSTKFTGRGLGLAAVLGIVRGHGGAITVNSAPGEGTLVTVFLPASRRALAQGGAAADSVPSAANQGLVLFADDEEAVRRVAGRILERAGFRFLGAQDGVEALELYDRFRAEVDVIILDLTMPRLSGEETFQALQERGCDAAILFTSGYSEYAMPAGGAATGFIQKPYQPAALIAAVSAAARERRGQRQAREAAV